MSESDVPEREDTRVRRESGAAPEADERGLPNWLAQVVTALVGPSPAALAGDSESDVARVARWRRLEECAGRWAGDEVPLSVLHVWFATSLGPLLAEAAVRAGEDAEHQQAVRELHRLGARGESVAADEWRVALEPALRQVYRRAYDVDQAFATASAAAGSFALSRGYDEADAVKYGRTYAQINTEANLAAHADANALAQAELLSRSFAADDAGAYASTFPAAYLRACIAACGTDDESRGRVRDSLAEGLVHCLEHADAA